MSTAKRAPGRTRVGSLFLAAALLSCGCGGGRSAGVRTSEDRSALRDIRSVKIRSTTIGAVTGEIYAGKAWHQIGRKHRPPYEPLSEGQLFGWTLLDELAHERRKAEKDARAGPRDRKRKEKEKRRQEKAKAQKAAAAKKAEEKKRAEKQKEEEAATAKRAEKVKPETEEETPKRGRRSRRAR